MVRIVRFVAESIQGGERELVDVVDCIFVARGTREAEFGAEVEEYVGGLAEEEVAVSEDGRGEVRWVWAGAGVGDEGFEGWHAGLGGGVTGVRVGGLGRFEAEADVLAAAGEGGPVEEFVGGCGGGFLAFGGWGGCHGGWAIGVRGLWGEV